MINWKINYNPHGSFGVDSILPNYSPPSHRYCHFLYECRWQTHEESHSYNSIVYFTPFLHREHVQSPTALLNLSADPSTKRCMLLQRWKRFFLFFISLFFHKTVTIVLGGLTESQQYVLFYADSTSGIQTFESLNSLMRSQPTSTHYIHPSLLPPLHMVDRLTHLSGQTGS